MNQQSRNSGRRIVLIGAGNISEIHAEALRSLPQTEITAVVDPEQSRAESLARRWRIPHAFTSIEELAGGDYADRAHVLVPPPLHAPIGKAAIAAGLHVLMEKPLAETSAQCSELIVAAKNADLQIGVNQNFVFHPAYARLKTLLREGRIGQLRHVSVTFNMPLRQLASGQVAHWMFQEPRNILLEQAVHPLSQMLDLAGSIDDISVLATPPRELAVGLNFVETWQIAFRQGDVTSNLFVSMGQDFPAWRLTAIGQDGIVEVDLHNNRIRLEEASRWPDFYDSFLSGSRAALAGAWQSSANAGGYVLSTLKLRPRSDTFYQSMCASIAAFHAGVDKNHVKMSGEFGAEIVSICEKIAEKIEPVESQQPKSKSRPKKWDVTVLGGTGFIGRHLVRRLLDDGLSVAVMARGTSIRHRPLDDPRVHLVSGNVADTDDVAKAIGKSRLVVNLAQGAAGSTAAEIEHAMVSAAEAVAEACQKQGVECLVHAGTIAALYLGDQGETITGITPIDPERRQRGEYANAKAAADERLLQLHKDKMLPVCIVRPGLVVGEGGLAFHSGLGFFNRDRHCMGWNGGQNPLPFVLASDVADAIANALQRGETVVGNCYNLVGDVRLTASEYIAELGRILGRPLRFHGQSVAMLQSVEIGKWLIKRAIGREARFPSYRDLRSRGMVARFDCSNAKRDLDWSPVSERARFIAMAIDVFGPTNER